MGRVYLSGPWTAPTEEARLAVMAQFGQAQAALEALGMDVCNPARSIDHTGPWHDVQRARLRLMLADEIGTVALLSGWSTATTERDVARQLGMRCTALCVLLSQPAQP